MDAMLFSVSRWFFEALSSTSVGPVTVTTVTALSSGRNPLST